MAAGYVNARNKLLEEIFATTPFAIACLDADFNFIRVNRGYAAEDSRETVSELPVN